MKTNTTVQDLMNGLDKAYLEGLEPLSVQHAPTLSQDRILALVRQKTGLPAASHTAEQEHGHRDCTAICSEPVGKQSRTHVQGKGTEARRPETRHIMKRKPILAIAAACILLLSATALAAHLGGLDFFGAIFDDDITQIAPYIQDTRAIATADGATLRLESLLTDGYDVSMVLSVEGEGGGNTPAPALFDVQVGDRAADGYTSHELEEFSQAGRQYYSIHVSSQTPSAHQEVTVSLRDLPLSVSAVPEAALGTKAVSFPAAAYAKENYAPLTLRLSPMGFLLKGREQAQGGGIPAPDILLKYRNGKTEVLLEKDRFDSQADGAIGGGGMVMGNGTQRFLAEEVRGYRNPASEVVAMGQFTRILQLENVVAVIVDGVEYPLP